MANKKYRSLVVVLLDILIIIFADWLSLAVRFDFVFSSIPTHYINLMRQIMPIQIVLTLVLFYFMRMYRFIWHAVTIQDVAQMILATVAAYIVNLVVTLLLYPRLPLSTYFAMLVLQVGLFCTMRSVFRFTKLIFGPSKRKNASQDRIMIIGAGSAGNVLLRELQTELTAEGKPCCLIDDNINKQGKFLNGVPIVGGREKIVEAADKYRITKIIFAIPTASTRDRGEILTLCAQTGRRVLTMPSIGETLGVADPSFQHLKQVRIEDLLGRSPVQLDTSSVNAFIRDKVVLVTGGGGSIGSELCRQIAANHPRRLIILDIYENNAYDIQQELIRTHGRALDLCVEIASVRDKAKVYAIFDAYRPDIVFHAAAHKHVPLMEHNPEEAVKNNIFGTYHVVRAAEKYGVAKFVMISTDKAVNPTNVMGASKRFCEMILQSRRDSRTEFCSVRFGNVLGSNGSVVPLFEKQIAAGGPITITDKRITRFFMTIPEAVQLVLEAGAMAGQNQIFVLDMGQPVTILSLAENMIRLHGLEPYKDIDIVEIGLRPGEKLYEELLMASEKLTRMGDKIFVEEQEDIDPEMIMSALEQLDDAVTGEWTQERLTALLRQVVTTFRTPEEINGRSDREPITV
ncbi:MAG: polysaccharide biosynthesis protein [Oscillospiraceae bacterium]|nr:polysaccharide biosynthesis protein [Oscillospiraceae bacterium]